MLDLHVFLTLVKSEFALTVYLLACLTTGTNTDCNFDVLGRA